MVVMAGAAAHRLVADHSLTDLDALHEPDLLELLHHAIHARARDLALAPEQRLLDLDRREGAGLLVEQSHDRPARAPPAIARLAQGPRRPLGPGAQLRRGSAHPMSVGLAHLPVARCSARARPSSSATCHCWKLALAGVSVSVTVAIGIFRARASSFTRCTSGVTFWLLNTQTSIRPSRTWSSPVRLSAAVTSVPSATDFAKP